MKVDELMVGDWVLFCGDKYQIRKEDFSANYEFEPIPLTYEILENNFGPNELSKLNIHAQYLSYPKQEMISAQLKPSPDCRKHLEVFNYVNKRGIKYECNQPDDVMYPFYVHELQHMLKLCNINDEIILNI